MNSSQYLDIIPLESSVCRAIENSIEGSKILVISGLPGVGKSIYVQLTQELVSRKGKPFDIIQWDIARKAFETKEILDIYPMGDGIVHNGVKLIAGKWLMDTLVDWIVANRDNERVLIIEAPLIGHRFVELVKPNAEYWFESYLSSDKLKFLVPIPSKKVRKKIEEARTVQVSDDAAVWVGAKPSVMLLLWKYTCEIANKFGKNISLEGQPEYDPEIYKFVFKKILKHRYFIPLHIDEIYLIPAQSEDALHAKESIVADKKTANWIGRFIQDLYTDSKEIDVIVENWYIS